MTEDLDQRLRAALRRAADFDPDVAAARERLEGLRRARRSRRIALTTTTVVALATLGLVIRMQGGDTDSVGLVAGQEPTSTMAASSTVPTTSTSSAEAGSDAAPAQPPCGAPTAAGMERVISAHGVSAVVPAGWDWYFFEGGPVDDGGRLASHLHVGSFELRKTEGGSLGEGEWQCMGDDDVFVALIFFGPDSAGTPLFAHSLRQELDPDMFSPRASPGGLPPGQSAIQAFFTENGRAFMLYVVLGSHEDRHTLVPRVEAFLAGITIAPGP